MFSQMLYSEDPHIYDTSMQYQACFCLLLGQIQMVRSYRSRDDIIVDVLEATFGGAKKTHIMQRANLNPVMFKKYFPVLLRNGWVVKEDDPDGGSLYRLSAEGKTLLKMYKVLRAKFRNKADGNAIQTC
jgi:predicted transcriptional regulator